MGEYAYSLPKTTPAELVETNTSLIARLIERDTSILYDGRILDQWTDPELNDKATYRTRRINSRPSRWYLRDFANDVFSYILDPGGSGGDVYNIDQAFVFMIYLDARRQARTELGEYYRAFVSSQFTAAGFTFLADPVSTVSYLVIAEIVRVDEAGAGYPQGDPQFVFDEDGKEFEVPTANDWNAFWNKYTGLFDEARDVTNTAWKDVQAATLTSEVEIIMDAMPPIPGTV